MPANVWTDLDSQGAATVLVKNLPDLIWLIRRLRTLYNRYRLSFITTDDQRYWVTIQLIKE